MWETSLQKTVNFWVKHLKCGRIDLDNKSSEKRMGKMFLYGNGIEIGIGMRISPRISGRRIRN
jgi:hypothetical protein